MPAASVTRSIELPVPADEAWSSVADAQGLAGWLADEVDLGVALGAAGRMVDGGVARRVVVTGLEEGRRLELTWWREDDPEVVSTVSIAVEQSADDDRRSTVTVTEQVAGGRVAACALASVDHLADGGHRWDARLDALLGATDGHRAPALV